MKHLLIFTVLLIQSGLALAQSRCMNDSVSKPQAQTAEASFAESFPSIEAAVRDFYANIVFRTENNPGYRIQEICTDAFLRRLAEANGYDAPGYATWLLRSGMQDGPDLPSEVLSIVPADGNTVIVNWSDMGVKGSTALTLIESGGRWKIDNATVPEGFDSL